MEKRIGKIYKMFCEGDEKLYIGSTFGTIKKRFNTHLFNIKNVRNNMYAYFFNKIGDNYDLMKIEELEEIMCDSRYDLHNREYEYIQEFIESHGRESLLNTKFINKPLYIGGVRMNDNIKQYNNAYYHDKNKEKILKPKWCECCEKNISSINWTKHINTKSHNKKYEKEFNNLFIETE
jgi:hypothetical protein